MTTKQRDKYAYELMVKNNPEEAVKQLLSKDKIIDDKLKEIELSIANELAVKNKRIDKAIEYVEEHQPVFEITSKQHLQEFFENEYYVNLLKILKGEENDN